jgi:hypothetical protein
MDATARIYGVLGYVQTLGFAILLFRLYATKLNKVYRYFSYYVLFEVVRLIVSASLPYRSNAYAYFYLACEPILWTLAALAMLEVYGMVLREHPGIANLGRKALVGSVGASILLSLCTLFLDYQNAVVKYPILDNFYLLSRLVMLSLLLFVLFIAFFLLWFPIPLNRNTVVHCGVFAAYFLVKGSTFVALRLAPESLVHVNAMIHVLITLCCGLWIGFLTPAGEKITAKIGHYWDPGQEERLMAQLDSINRTLVHSAKD